MTNASDAKASFRSDLQAALGTSGLVVDKDAMVPYCVDWRGEFGAPAVAVVRPKTVDQVSAVVRLCAAQGVAIVPQGGNTSLAGGSVPIAGQPQIVLNLSRMNAIRAVDPIGMTLTAEAGAVLETVQEAAQAHNLLFPVSFAAQGSSQIGGVVSTNAGGINVLRYGMTRQRVLGIEAVLANGTIVNGLRRLHKDNAGYDWKHLLIGTEGTLGIVTAASLRLAPRPRHRVTALLAVPAPDAALTLLRHATDELGDAISGFELISPVALELVKQHFGLKPPLELDSWGVLIEAVASLSGLRDGMEAALSAALEAGDATDGVIAETETQAAALWALREHVSEAELKAGRSVKHDVSVPIDKIPAFINDATESLSGLFPDSQVVAFGHVGDGNVHFNVLGVAPEDKAAVNRAVHDVVAGYHGSISAEHGIGSYRVDELAHYKQTTQMALMRTIKQALDPRGLLNPGKIFGRT
ncbi:MAG: hydroxyacid dehydrogenase [Stutzerimonas stutzeri]|nr:MAG: hydroxyacid dehydrogenase [Stutzerimonas stutzeri]